MEIVRVAGFAMTAAFAAAGYTAHAPEAGMGLALAAGVMLLLVALSQVQTVADALRQLCDKAQLQPAMCARCLRRWGYAFLQTLQRMYAGMWRRRGSHSGWKPLAAC